MKFFLLLLLLVSNLYAQTIEQFLDVDRFTFYVKEWSGQMRKDGKVEIANAITNLKPQEIMAMNLDPVMMGDVQKYDDVIFSILQKKFPQIKVSRPDVTWNYNFRKNKINEAFRATKESRLSIPETDPKPQAKPTSSVFQPSPENADDILLDVEGYAASRSTRAVYWEASNSGRKIELHIGTSADFKKNMTDRGVKILGEVSTDSRAYNPTYMIQEPGEKSFHYAITEISGADRLEHYQKQIALIKWNEKPGFFKKGTAPTQIVGSPAANLLAKEKELTDILKTMPKADHVVIGQLGNIEKTFKNLGKMKVIAELAKKSPDAAQALLDPKFLKLIAKFNEGEDTATVFVMKYGSDIDKMYEAVEKSLEKNGVAAAPNPVISSIDDGMYKMTDFSIADDKGVVKRWRVFSNVWGDEVVPIGKALKATGHNKVSYMGTAGALPNNGLKVGDLVVPDKTYNPAGKVRNVNHFLSPLNAKKVNGVVNVSTPFVETKAWLDKVSKTAQVVEVETSYLTEIFNGPEDKLSVSLLISDVVGSEHETLAAATSASRRNAQIAGISAILDHGKASFPVVSTLDLDDFSKWLRELKPNLDDLARMQVVREAHAKGIKTRPEFEAFANAEKSFTQTKLLDSLEKGEAKLVRVLEGMMNNGHHPTISLHHEFFEGYWNPSDNPIQVRLEVTNSSAKEEALRIIDKLSKEDKTFKKSISLTVGFGEDKNFKRLPNFLESEDDFLSLYKVVALENGGLATTETRTGKTKFVQVDSFQTDSALARTAYFEPNAETKQLLEEFKTSPREMEKILNKKIKNLNASGAGKNWEIVLSKVDDLPDGALANIVPNLYKDKIQIDLKITKEGLSNPAVVLEEYTHLEQITGGGSGKVSAFSHPYEWVETTANADAGSIRAKEKLARLEVEAAKSADYMVDQYSDLRLPDSEKANKYIDLRVKHAEENYAPIAKAAKDDYTRRQKAYEKLRTVFSDLEKSNPDFHLMVAKNDRAGVRKMMEQYLPWDLMEPSETKAWKTWLDAIEFPDKTNTEIVFRGLADDKLIMKETGKPGMLSTVMTRNQNSYTYRLRSLATLREKIGIYKPSNPHYVHPTTTNTPSIFNIMAQHARDPVGSPFLSTSNYEVASRFANSAEGKNMVALKVDKRRLVPNAMAWSYAGEQEKLIPLVVFPDEVLAYQGAENFNEKAFKAEVEKNLGRSLTKQELSGKGTPEEFFTSGYQRVRDIILTPDGSNLNVCEINSPKMKKGVFSALMSFFK